MSTLMKIMLVPALVVAFSVGVALAAGGGGDDQLAQVAPTSSTVEDSTTTDATTTTSTGVDVSGPCDEAEHANDPRCTGAGDDVADDRGDDDREPGEDLRPVRRGRARERPALHGRRRRRSARKLRLRPRR